MRSCVAQSPVLVIGPETTTALAGLAALRSGAFDVRIITSKESFPVVSQFNLNYTVEYFSDEDHLPEMKQDPYALIRQSDCIVLDEGLQSGDLLKYLYTESHTPLIIHPAVFDRIIKLGFHTKASAPAIVILDSNSVNFKITYSSIDQIVKQTHCVFVTLGSRRLILQDVREDVLNTDTDHTLRHGNISVNLGTIAGLFVHQKKDFFESAVLGTHFFGISADLAKNDLTSYCILPTDIVDYLIVAFAGNSQMNTQKKKEKR